jgi:hypothetical protein
VTRIQTFELVEEEVEVWRSFDSCLRPLLLHLLLDHDPRCARPFDGVFVESASDATSSNGWYDPQARAARFGRHVLLPGKRHLAPRDRRWKRDGVRRHEEYMGAGGTFSESCMI